MTNTTAVPFNSTSSLTLPSRLLLSGQKDVPADGLMLDKTEFEQFSHLASSHHVIMRAMEAFRELTTIAGQDEEAVWAQVAIARETARIERALSFLSAICEMLQRAGCDVTVIKSLDHWPDLGSDLDLYTNAGPALVIRLMQDRFHARLAPRSWGDRLANKWNFLLPGLPEAVEIHMGRLGQTGEQVTVARSLVGRGRSLMIGHREFHVPAAEDRLMISTMQRMYRHFYFRLCDIVDSAALLHTGLVNYDKLHRWADESGIWQGVATYLVIVSNYVAHYRGQDLYLPSYVRDAAAFGGERICFNRGFLRVPILQAVPLYASELKTLLLKRQFVNGARLSLLPCLATAAAVGQKITGSDKGIW